MNFTPTRIAGAWLVGAERRSDPRGHFERVWCAREFAAHGVPGGPLQASVSRNLRAGTLRGLHFQCAPAAEGKLVRCSRGALFDVAVDLRPASESFGAWFGTRLSEDQATGLYIPAGCAHGFQTLVDDTEVSYLIDQYYRPECARGLRWDDPDLGIEWPLAVSVISERDAALPGLAELDLE